MTTAVAAKERPIIFSGESVRAILEGRKTQTRRAIKPQPPDSRYELARLASSTATADRKNEGRHHWILRDGLRITDNDQPYFSLPFATGDRLWVRETWVQLLHTSPATDQPLTIGPGERLIEPATSWVDGQGRTHWHYDGTVIAYRANSNIDFCDGDGFTGESADKDDTPRWHSPIHMPRWASRLTLEIAKVRVERVQEISEEDAIAEGFDSDCDGECGHTPCAFIIPGFQALWDSLNAKRGYSWESNPWVWVLEFAPINAPTGRQLTVSGA